MAEPQNTVQYANKLIPRIDYLIKRNINEFKCLGFGILFRRVCAAEDPHEFRRYFLYMINAMTKNEHLYQFYYDIGIMELIAGMLYSKCDFLKELAAAAINQSYRVNFRESRRWLELRVLKKLYDIVLVDEIPPNRSTLVSAFGALYGLLRTHRPQELLKTDIYDFVAANRNSLGQLGQDYLELFAYGRSQEFRVTWLPNFEPAFLTTFGTILKIPSGPALYSRDRLDLCDRFHIAPQVRIVRHYYLSTNIHLVLFEFVRSQVTAEALNVELQRVEEDPHFLEDDEEDIDDDDDDDDLPIQPNVVGDYAAYGNLMPPYPRENGERFNLQQLAINAYNNYRELINPPMVGFLRPIYNFDRDAAIHLRAGFRRIQMDNLRNGQNGVLNGVQNGQHLREGEQNIENIENVNPNRMMNGNHSNDVERPPLRGDMPRRQPGDMYGPPANPNVYYAALVYNFETPPISDQHRRLVEAINEAHENRNDLIQGRIALEMGHRDFILDSLKNTLQNKVGSIVSRPRVGVRNLNRAKRCRDIRIFEINVLEQKIREQPSLDDFDEDTTDNLERSNDLTKFHLCYRPKIYVPETQIEPQIEPSSIFKDIPVDLYQQFNVDKAVDTANQLAQHGYQSMEYYMHWCDNCQLARRKSEIDIKILNQKVEVLNQMPELTEDDIKCFDRDLPVPLFNKDAEILALVEEEVASIRILNAASDVVPENVFDHNEKRHRGPNVGRRSQDALTESRIHRRVVPQVNRPIVDTVPLRRVSVTALACGIIAWYTTYVMSRFTHLCSTVWNRFTNIFKKSNTDNSNLQPESSFSTFIFGIGAFYTILAWHYYCRIESYATRIFNYVYDKSYNALTMGLTEISQINEGEDTPINLSLNSDDIVVNEQPEEEVTAVVLNNSDMNGFEDDEEFDTVNENNDDRNSVTDERSVIIRVEKVDMVEYLNRNRSDNVNTINVHKICCDEIDSDDEYCDKNVEKDCKSEATNDINEQPEHNTSDINKTGCNPCYSEPQCIIETLEVRTETINEYVSSHDVVEDVFCEDTDISLVVSAPDTVSEFDIDDLLERVTREE